jgi:hypothetical protein
MTFIDSVFVNGGIGSVYGEGTRTETEGYDSATLAYNNDLVPGRDAAATCPGHKTAGDGGAVCYTEYGGPHNGVSPPVTIYLTPTATCSGADPTAESCSGIVGAMSTSTFPAVLSDWHDYRLCHTGDAACNDKASPYAAGQAHAATDGTDLGFDPTQIDGAQVSTQYSCQTPCGSGPYPD